MNKIKFRVEIFILFPVFIASIIALLSYPLKTEARIVRSPSDNRTCWSANLINSAFGKYYADSAYRPGYNPPIYLYRDCHTGGADINDRAAVSPYTFQGAGSWRNLSTYSSYIPITTTTGINYDTYYGIGMDSYGFEDTTLQYAVCDGTYPDDSSQYTHNCLKGQLFYDSFGEAPSWPPEGDGDSVVPYPPAVKSGFPDNLGPDAYRAYATDYMFKSGNVHFSTTSNSIDGFDSNWLNLHFKRIAIASCSTRNICTDESHMATRQADCNYLTPIACDGICINGTCDPATVPAANVTTNPISPVTDSDPTHKITITTAEGLLQCKYKKDYGQVWINDTIGYGETYYVDEKYGIDATVPSTAKYIMAWIAPDQTYSTEANQRPVYLNGRYDLSVNGSTGYYGTFDTSSRVLHLDLFPSVSWHSSSWPYSGSDRSDFWDETSSRKAQFGAYGRGDSFVLQLQANNAASNQNPWQRSIKDTQYAPYAESPAPITLPTYYHFTMPSYQQCAGPAEVTTATVSSSTVSCSNPVNRISWTSVSGADQYLVLIRKTSGNLSLYDGYALAYGDFTATTTNTYYDYTVPTPFDGSTYKVKIYAHNSSGWNISNTTTSFDTSTNCNCTTSTGATISGNTGAYFYPNATSTTSCPSYYRYCDGSTGTLSGNTSANYSSCSIVYAYCTGPDGVQVPAGTSRTYYTTTSGTCTGTQRTCNGSTGVLSGSSAYQYGTCTPSIPSTPTGVTATAQNYCGGGNSISWNYASGVTGYRVYRATSLNGTYTELTGSSGTPSSPYTDTSTNPSTTYYYKVLAFNSYGSSAQSSATSATTPAVCSTTGSIEVTRYSTDLSTPANAPSGTYGKVDSITSSASNPAIFEDLSQGYHTAKATDLSGYAEKFGACTYTIGSTPCTLNSWSFYQTPTCTGGYCSISAYVNTGEVTKVGVMYVSAPTNPPTSLTATTGASCGKLIDLTWDYTSGATAYRIYRSTTSNGTYTEITDPTVGVQSLAYTDSTPDAEARYYYKVAAFNDGGTSPLSGAVSAVSTQICLHVGTIQITRYGPDLGWPSTAPDGTEGLVDNLQATTTNPATFNNVDADTSHAVKVTNTTGYLIKMASCSYNVGDPECEITGDQLADGSPSLMIVNCDIDYCVGYVDVLENTVVKVAAMYTSTMGSIRVSHYGSDLNAWPQTDLPLNIFSKVDSTSTVPSLDNPKDYANQSNDLHTVYIPDVSSDYTITYGSCTYVEGTSDCPLQEWEFTMSPVCDGAYCALQNVQVYTGLTTKIGIRYVSNTSPIPTPTISGPTTGVPNTNYTFTAVSGSSNQARLNKLTQTAQVSSALLAQTAIQLQYGFDWDNDGYVDEFQPESGYVDTGVSVSAVHSWSTPNSYSFKVKAIDDHGNSSNWATFNIVIGSSCQSPLQSDPNNPGSCRCINGLGSSYKPLCRCDSGNREYQQGSSCVQCPNYRTYTASTYTCAPCPNGTYDTGTECANSSVKITTLTVNPNLVNPGDKTNISITVEGAQNCTLEGGGRSYSVNLDENGYVSDTILSDSIRIDTVFTATCTPIDTNVPAVTKKVTCNVKPLIKEK